ncbi:MAG TPA: hypothetical protein VKA30_13035 [Actinomycetota bacterium]|nr:hypothetical protein [Actinomycetota bacterium]
MAARSRGSGSRWRHWLGLALALLLLTGCPGNEPTGSPGSPSPTPSCVSDEMGRSPCPPQSSSAAARTETGEDSEEEEREEYAEQREECERIRERYGFYPFKFCTRYGDEEY